MAEMIAVVGQSGSGKSRSVKGLNPEETLFISVASKPIPMKGYKSVYTPLSKDGTTGNYINTKDSNTIIQILNLVDKKRLDIKNVVIDDYQYLGGFEYFARAQEKGYEKFSVIADMISKPVIKGVDLREDLKIFVLTHDEMTQENFKPLRKIKTVGKMVDSALTMEGLFTVVLFTDVNKDDAENIQYGFITNSDGSTTAKSPEEMFDSNIIDNDLGLVAKSIDEYYGN